MEYWIMLKFFKKEPSNQTFSLELTKKKINEDWLSNALKSDYVDINHKDKNGDTSLIKCVKEGRYNSAEWLIKNGADINLKDNNGRNILEIAVEKNNLPIVKGLLDLGKIDVNQKDITGRSLLQNVVVWGNHQMAKLLLNNGADINSVDNYGRIVLYDALAYGDQGFLRYLLSLDKLNINHIDDEGNTLMQYPEVHKNDSIAKDILAAGIDPTIQKENEESFFYKTMIREDKDAEDVIELALANGANVNALTYSGKTLLIELIYLASHLSKGKRPLRMIYLNRAKRMLQVDGDINTLDSKNESALFNAVALRDFELILFLLESGINPNIQNINGETVLEFLLYDGLEYMNILKLLLDYKIDPKLKNKKGQSSFEILSNIILHNSKKVLINDKSLVKLIDPEGLYMEILKILLVFEQRNMDENQKYMLDILDSSGDPLFFKPLMNNHFSLFNLYTKFKINLHKLNKNKYNIFYAYVLQTFERNIATPIACKNFQENISSLISRKIDRHFKDSLGWTILHKITSTKCNINLFLILINTVRFDFTIKDNLGRTVIHNCVWHDQEEVIKLVNAQSSKIISIEDNYFIPPIYYAALLGNAHLVLLLFELGATINLSQAINPKAIKKFSPMLKNLPKLKEKITETYLIERIDTLIDQINIDFN